MSGKLTLYGIRNCDTVKRARQALDEAGIDFHFHDFKVDGLDERVAQKWIDALGADTVLNRRGTTWRKLDPGQQARAETDCAALLAEHPSLVKRPVWAYRNSLRVGFPKATADEFMAWAVA